MEHLLGLLLTFAIVYISSSDTCTSTKGELAFTVSSMQSRDTWYIKPTAPTANRIQFVFRSLNILQAELRIYDADRLSSGQTVYSCSSCGTVLPPPFFSQTGDVVITISGVIGVSFTKSDFDLQYIGTPTAYTSSLENISISLNMGYGHISPVRVNNSFLQPYSSQQWIVSQKEGAKLTMFFTPLPASSEIYTNLADCGSHVHVYDDVATPRSVLFSSCVASYGASTDWFYSYTGIAVVELVVSTGSPMESSFELTFSSDTELYRCGSYTSPDVLIGYSMVLVDGSASTKPQHKGETCSWLIQSSDMDDQVNLIMDTVSLKYGSNIAVYDGTGMDGQRLWFGDGYTTVVPAIITSSKRSLFVRYFTDATVSASTYGFRGEYFLSATAATDYKSEIRRTSSRNMVGLGKGYTVLAMASLMEASASTGTDELVQNTAPGGSNYSWFVRPKNSIGIITFFFSSVSLARPGDSIAVYDGSSGNLEDTSALLTTFDYYNKGLYERKWVRTSKTQAVIVYRSSQTAPINESNKNSTKFSFSYYTDGKNYHCGFIRNPAIARSASMILTDGSQSSESVYKNQDCQWTLQPPDSAGVVFVFDRLSFRKGVSLQVYNGTVAGGELYATLENAVAAPSPFVFPFPTVGLAYTSGAEASGYGFRLTYFGLSNNNMQDSFPGNNLVTLTCSSIVSLSLPLAFSEQRIPANSTFSWALSPANAQGTIYIALSWAYFENCSTTALEIFDGGGVTSSLLGAWCLERSDKLRLLPESASRGNIPLWNYQWLQTSTSAAFVRFSNGLDSSSGESTTYSDNKGDFRLSYFSDAPSAFCGLTGNPAIMVAPSMIISDGSSSEQIMYSGQSCSWLIQPAADSPWITAAINEKAVRTNLSYTAKVRVGLELLSSDLRGGSLALYDGEDSDAPILWQCVNADCSELPRLLFSSTESMYVSLSTKSEDSDSTLGYGFLAVYWSWVDLIEDESVHESFSIDTGYSVLLDLPGDIKMSNGVDNRTHAYRVMLGPNDDSAAFVSSTTVSMYSRYKTTDRSAVLAPVCTDDGKCDIGTVLALDGRASGSTLQQSSVTSAGSDSLFVCGEARRVGSVHSTIYFSDDDINRENQMSSVVYRPTQGAMNHRLSSSSAKESVSWIGVQDMGVPNDVASFTGADSSSSQFNTQASPASVCKFVVESDNISPNVSGVTRSERLGSSNRAVDVFIEDFIFSEGERLRIYGGLTNVDALLFDSNDVLNQVSSYSKKELSRVFINNLGRQYFSMQPMNITAPCGHALIIFEYGQLWEQMPLNDTAVSVNRSTVPLGPGSASPTSVPSYAPTLSNVEMYNYTLKLSFFLSPLKSATAPGDSTCRAYEKSLNAKSEEEEHDTLYIMFALAAIFVVIGALCIHFFPYLLRKWNIFQRSMRRASGHRYGGGIGSVRQRRYVVKVKDHAFHPAHRPKVDAIRNRFLPKGYCVVCKHMDLKVFTLQCGHSLCTEDLEGYLEAALGDISSFPVKCPMHYDGCTKTIESRTAKRVLNAKQYAKFLEFSDRSLYGDGMRCIYCANYVIFPPDVNAVTRAECPYCFDEFCVRCKRPWHTSQSPCPMETQDESLELWKVRSGAQKCPMCKKIIEKNDPSTCHHMVHKSTDPIPCFRDRTDFCYLCGEEVLPDYPHDEVNNLGVNHFPNGVFEKCRHIINEEKAQERERLRRLSRRNKGGPRGQSTTRRVFQMPSASVSPEAPRRQDTPAAGAHRARSAPAGGGTAHTFQHHLPALTLFDAGGYMELSDEEYEANMAAAANVGAGDEGVGDHTARQIQAMELGVFGEGRGGW